MTIDVPHECQQDVISRDAGRKIRLLITENWDKEEYIKLQFNNVLIASVSFFDEAIGLLLKRGNKTIQEIQKKITFVGLQDSDRILLNNVVRTRLAEHDIRRGRKRRF